MGAAFVGFAAFGIKEANEAEQALNKLGVTLSNFAYEYTSETRKEIEDLTGSYVDLGFGGEEAAAGFDVLFSSTGDLEASHKRYLPHRPIWLALKIFHLLTRLLLLLKQVRRSAKAFKEMGIEL
jgi:hypothetical protein